MKYQVWFSGLIYKGDQGKCDLYENSFMTLTEDQYKTFCIAKERGNSCGTGIYVVSLEVVRVELPVIQKDFGSSLDRYNSIPSLDEELPF